MTDFTGKIKADLRDPRPSRAGAGRQQDDTAACLGS
jgi:hypothetical protein